MKKTDLAIIGSGLASVNLIKELRKAGDTRKITVLTQEAGHFYSKPMLSNALSKSKTPANLPVQDAQAFAAQFQVEMLAFTRVTALDLDQKSLRYRLAAEDGQAASQAEETVLWDQLVLAMGAQPVSLESVGAQIDAPVFTVNQLSEYAQFHQTLQQLTESRTADQVRVGIVGSGLIGCEFANDLANQGYQVSVFDVMEWPMARFLPPELSNVLGHALSEKGVQWYWQQAISRVSPVQAPIQNGVQLETAQGLSVEVDLVLSAIGLKPNVGLAQAAGLSCGPGVQVDPYLRSSHPDVFALGDCATVSGISLQYVLPLMACARALSKTLTGQPTPVVYPAMPVVVKTPACPTVVALPPWDIEEANWRVSGEGADLRALLVDAEDKTIGFALTGEAVKEKNALAKKLPDWLVAPQ